MIRYRWLLFPLVSMSIVVHAQSTAPAIAPVIDSMLSSIRKFSRDEQIRDSVAHHLLGSNTESDFRKRYDFYHDVRTRMDTVDRDRLSFDDQINLDLLRYSVDDEISWYRFKGYLNPILADEGFHTGLASMGSEVLSSRKEAEDYIARLNDVPRYFRENIDLMRKGLELGISQPRAILNGYQNTYEQHIVSDPTKSLFYKPFLTRPFAISEADWKNLQRDATNAIDSAVVKSYKELKAFFDTEYLPHARNTIGVSNFPDGLAFYQDRVNHYTSTDLSYDSIYQLGLREVARIKAGMLQVVRDVHFKGDLRQFITYLRNEPRFYAKTPDDLLKEASYIAKKIDGVLPRFFSLLPRQPYGVEAVPAHLAPTYTGGRYAGSPIGSKRAGFYWVNTYALKSRPLYVLEALTMHEAVPGHHLQIALTQELESLPPFRRNLYVNAFGEGWGLYSEFLGTEMGFYKDPYSLFGRLTYEMWRACRLVIDVGLHAKGWTREDAVKYLADNTALSLHEVNTEINRYISWPGQALAYKIGELTIREQRKRAEEQLKEKFDVREFHAMVLSRGTVTMKILAQMTDRFIAEKQKQ